MASFFNQVVKAVVDRLPTGSLQKQAFVDVAFQHLAEVAYSRLKRAGFEPGTIIDVGAFMGEWTKLAKSIFPRAPVILIEAQKELETQLRSVTSQYRDAEYRIALLGASQEKSVPFHVGGTGSSLFRERSNASMTTINSQMTTLDRILLGSERRGPIFLKLDVQGAEIDVLRGGVDTLEATEVLQLETALLPYNEGAPTAAEIFSFVDDRGFAMFDVSGFIRPNENDLVQLDIIFVRKNSKLRSRKIYFVNGQ